MGELKKREPVRMRSYNLSATSVALCELKFSSCFILFICIFLGRLTCYVLLYPLIYDSIVIC